MSRIKIPGLAASLQRSGNEALKKIAADLSKPGEAGRAVPGPLRGEVKTEKVDTQVSGRTDIYTRITKPSNKSELLYSADNWVRMRLLLETAGPVAVSTRQDIVPVLSGKGILLQTGEYVEFTIPRGDRVYIASNTVNRVQVFVEPFPWLESMLLTLKALLGGGR